MPDEGFTKRMRFMNDHTCISAIGALSTHWVGEEEIGGEETGCGPDKSGCVSWSRSDLFTACELAVPLVAREVWMLVCITTVTRAPCVICVSVDGVWV